MKKSAMLILCFVLLFSCSQELPPRPPPPGQFGAGRAVAGISSGLPMWATEAKNVALTPPEAYYGDGIVLSVSNFDYVYSSGYIFNSKTRIWEKFSLQGTAVEDWLKGGGIGSVSIDKDRFAEGSNYLVIYACSKISGKWLCNEGKWMLVPFTVKGLAKGVIPQIANVDKFVVNSAIQRFALGMTTGEKDNFADINVIRYDANYREPQGLNVLVHVFDFNTRAEVDQTVSSMFAAIVSNGAQVYSGNTIALFLDENNHRIAVWTSGKEIVYVETFKPDSASKEIIDAYLQKYPSDLKKP